MPLDGLAECWRRRAAVLEPYAPASARAFEECAQELERALAGHADQVLTLAEASAFSGYSVDHLARLIRQGKLRNWGRPRAPRLRRGDLPRKRGGLPAWWLVPYGGSARQVARVVRTHEGAR